MSLVVRQIAEIGRNTQEMLFSVSMCGAVGRLADSGGLSKGGLVR